jgi:hypothetical protein
VMGSGTAQEGDEVLTAIRSLETQHVTLGSGTSRASCGKARMGRACPVLKRLASRRKMAHVVPCSVAQMQPDTQGQRMNAARPYDTPPRTTRPRGLWGGRQR